MRVLFVCTGNTCRSPMAAGLFNARSPDPTWQATSAGLAAWPGQPATDLAVKALLAGYDIDISSHRSRRLDEALLDEPDLILTMNAHQREFLRILLADHPAIVLTIGEMAGEPNVEIPDPYGQDQPAYDDTAAALVRLIDRIFQQIASNF
jgi:ribose 5-phosphate isomerase B